MTRILCFVLLFCLGAVGISAKKISREEALVKARTFVQERGRVLMSRQMRLAPATDQETPETLEQSGEAAYYIFNIGHEDGFVIVSGDDQAETILGYADSGAIGEEMPEALRQLLAAYAEQLSRLDEQAPQLAMPFRAARASIAPLIKTRWNQGAPYNLYCPSVDDTRTVTGCVATSMAQVMYYHRYPTEATDTIPAYTTRTKKIAMSELKATTFDWANMALSYASSEENNAANRAVATLMSYCGCSLQMNYNVSSVGGSSAYNVSIADALKLYFGYSDQVDIAIRSTYSYTEWVDLLYGELAEARPVILGGQAVGSGHSFVCDGYDSGDYFHINWGWGGQSDGYFRLSALNPSEQGIGGSSTLDGFSFKQEAIIGIEPGNGSKPQLCTSLERLQFVASETSLQRVIERSSAADDFTDIPVYASYCNYAFATTSYDLSLQLVDGDGKSVATPLKITNQSMEFNKDLNVTATVTIPSTVSDGTYYLTAYSRPTGKSYWKACYQSSRLRMTAVIADNKLTLTIPNAQSSTDMMPTCSAIATSDSPTKGYEVEVTATVVGSTMPFCGNMYLYAGGKMMMGKQVDIPAGEQVEVRFAYTPSASGDNTLAIYAEGTKLREQVITVAESDVQTDLTLTMVPTIENLKDGKLYGNMVRLTVRASNASTTNSYVGRLNCSLRRYEDTETDDFTANVKRQTIVVAKDSYTDVDFVFDGLETGIYYCLRITYIKTTGDVSTVVDGALTDRYQMTEGYLLYAADGSSTIHLKEAAIDAGTAACVDMSTISDLSDVTITPSSNPNCLYLLSRTATVPTELSSANVVQDGSATQITLTDGAEFFSPIDFTVSNISYNRTFTLAADVTKGWNTILLPFTVTTVSCGGNSVDWFHSSSDTGKNFWLKTFTGDAEGHVYFDFADAMTANTPYIIAVPDDRWGEAWQMTDKTVTFSGTNAKISATAVSSLSGNNYQFCGATNSQTLTDVYLLNAKGSSFVKGSGTTEPFRAWIKGDALSSLTHASLQIMSGIPTALDVPRVGSMQDKTAEYDLSGRRMERQGQHGRFIISGGKKYLRQ